MLGRGAPEGSGDGAPGEGAACPRSGVEFLLSCFLQMRGMFSGELGYCPACLTVHPHPTPPHSTFIFSAPSCVVSPSSEGSPFPSPGWITGAVASPPPGNGGCTGFLAGLNIGGCKRNSARREVWKAPWGFPLPPPARSVEAPLPQFTSLLLPGTTEVTLKLIHPSSASFSRSTGFAFFTGALDSSHQTLLP